MIDGGSERGEGGNPICVIAVTASVVILCHAS